jgi:hypothetical protein
MPRPESDLLPASLKQSVADIAASDALVRLEPDLGEIPSRFRLIRRLIRDEAKRRGIEPPATAPPSRPMKARAHDPATP